MDEAWMSAMRAHSSGRLSACRSRVLRLLERELEPEWLANINPTMEGCPGRRHEGPVTQRFVFVYTQ